MKKVLGVFSKCLLIALIASFSIGSLKGQTPQPTQKKPLTLTNILVALGSQKILDMEEKNRILIEAVIDRGITFTVTPEIEDELKRAGASEALINAIKMKAQVSSSQNQPNNPQPAVDYTAYEKRADSYVQKGKYELAIPLYDQAIAINPKVSSLYVKRGFAFFNTQDPDLALLDYNKAIELNPKDALAFFYRAQLHEKNRNLEDALEDYKKAAELDPNNEQAKTALKNIMAQLPKPTPSPPQGQIASVNTSPVQPPVTQPPVQPINPNTSSEKPKPVEPKPIEKPKSNESEPKEKPKSTESKPSEKPKSSETKPIEEKPNSSVQPPVTTNVPKNNPEQPKPSESQIAQIGSEVKNPQPSSVATTNPRMSNNPQKPTEEQINSILETNLEDVIIGVGQITSSDIVRLVKPVYPQVAQRAGIGGQVRVEVTWDEQGKVISAKAIEGHTLLRSVCEDAARKSEFKPRIIEGKPVKARGFLVFSFAK
jgi:TonB family protein